MHEALHPFRNFPRITVVDHIREFGNDKVPQREFARCPVCKQPLRIDAGSSASSVGHFSHQANLGFCPTKIKAGRPYAGLLPNRPDPEAARRMKAAFREHWTQHFEKLNELVKWLHVNEFIEVVQFEALATFFSAVFGVCEVMVLALLQTVLAQANEEDNPGL